jgi:hypothetical protein
VTEQGSNVRELGSVRPNSFSVNLIHPGKANWYAENIPSMNLAVLKNHAMDLENQLASFERGNLPLTQNDVIEINKCLTLLHTRIDELLPKAPALIETHDNVWGNRITSSWPSDLPESSMRMHMHFCELIYTWQMSPHRRETSTPTVDECAEAHGASRFIFSDKADAGNFIDAYDLEDFILVEVTRTGLSDSNTNKPFYFIELTNKFAHNAVHEFLAIYQSAINALTVIYDERRRAVSYDNGKYGYVTSAHFTTRETVELNRIRAAREVLGAGFRNINT